MTFSLYGYVAVCIIFCCVIVLDDLVIAAAATVIVAKSVALAGGLARFER